METIIGLLFILLPVIFKMIGNRLEKSGAQDKARKVREFAQALDGEDSPMHDWKYFGKEVLGTGEGEQIQDMEDELPRQAGSAPAPIVTAAAAAAPVQEDRPSVSRKQLLVEEEQDKGEKIDPKKLVIYSEIMKPKFKE